MSSLPYYQRSAPFWDWVASLEEQASSHPVFGSARQGSHQHAPPPPGASFGRGPHPGAWPFMGQGFPFGDYAHDTRGHHHGPFAHRERGETFYDYDEENCSTSDTEKDAEKNAADASMSTDETATNNENAKDGAETPRGPNDANAATSAAREDVTDGENGRHGRRGRRHGPHHHGHEFGGRGGLGGHGGHGGHGGRGRGGPRGGWHGRHSHSHSHHGPPRGDAGPWGTFRNLPSLFNPWMHEIFGNVDGSGRNTSEDPHDNSNKNEDNDFKPVVDVFDGPDAYVLHIPLAGAKKEDIAVNWDPEKSEVIVSGVVHRPGDEEFLKTLALAERQIGAFERKVRLGSPMHPAQIYIEGITAKLEDGLLRVEVPKEDKELVNVRKVDIE